MARIIIIARGLYKKDKAKAPIFPSVKKTQRGRYLLLLQGDLYEVKHIPR
jgi:hypothetical protein